MSFFPYSTQNRLLKNLANCIFRMNRQIFDLPIIPRSYMEFLAYNCLYCGAIGQYNVTFVFLADIKDALCY